MAGKSDMSPAIHNITFCGVTGGIFVLLTAALILYIEGFVTTSWTISGDNFTGLWQTCRYQHREDMGGWFTTSQVLVTIGLFGVIVSFVLSTIYMTANRASKNLTLVSLAFISIVTVVFVLIALILFGVKKNTEVSWSYGVIVIAAILTFLAGILSILQIRRANVNIC